MKHKFLLIKNGGILMNAYTTVIEVITFIATAFILAILAIVAIPVIWLVDRRGVV